MKIKLHASVTIDRVTEAVHQSTFGLDNPGFCCSCGADAEGVEPDARNYTCEKCGSNSVFGAQELLFII
jgi:predicted amidophosphoribosyltransferase